MIPRYNRPVIQSIWSDENKFNIWTEIECLIAEKLSEIGEIPNKAAEDIRKKAKFNIDEIKDIEKETKHDVVAYINNVSAYIGENSKYFHFGVTSSDIIDTGFSFQLKQTAEIIAEQLKKLINNLKQKSIEHKYTFMIGRSHGVHAEQISFGLKMGSFYFEFLRNLKRLEIAKEEISICSISGPVGTYNSIDPRIEEHVAKKLNLKTEDISTQVIPRDRHAFYFSTLGIIASSIERLVIEIRHLQRTEILEVEEFFSSGQKGSSAMPHKRNPILSENLTGLARMVRSYVIPALENISLWHERDISHSSVERNIGPDSTVTIDFALNRLGNILENMIVYPKKMQENLNITNGLIFSQRVLLELTKYGFSREKAYKIVRRNAQNSWKKSINFYESLANDKDIKNNISKKDLNKMFDVNYHTKKVNSIFKRVFKKNE